MSGVINQYSYLYECLAPCGVMTSGPISEIYGPLIGTCPFEKADDLSRYDIEAISYYVPQPSTA